MVGKQSESPRKFVVPTDEETEPVADRLEEMLQQEEYVEGEEDDEGDGDEQGGDHDALPKFQP